LELTWQQQGDYPFPYKGVQLYLHGMNLQQAWVDGTEAVYQENRVDIDSIFEQVRLH
jgi:alpha-glucosidase